MTLAGPGPLPSLVFWKVLSPAVGAFCWLLVGRVPFVACIFLASGLAAHGFQAVTSRASSLVSWRPSSAT
jgi:hypothetical protein